MERVTYPQKQRPADQTSGQRVSTMVAFLRTLFPSLGYASLGSLPLRDCHVVIQSTGKPLRTRFSTTAHCPCMVDSGRSIRSCQARLTDRTPWQFVRSRGGAPAQGCRSCRIQSLDDSPSTSAGEDEADRYVREDRLRGYILDVAGGADCRTRRSDVAAPGEPVEDGVRSHRTLDPCRREQRPS